MEPWQAQSTTSMFSNLEMTGQHKDSIAFDRARYVHEWCDQLLQTPQNCKHYWQASKGSGKSVFLRLLAKELQQRGLPIYLINGNWTITLEQMNEVVILNETQGKRTVLIIDDADTVFENNAFLLNELHTLILLAVGVKTGNHDEAALTCHGPAEVFLQESEIPDLAMVWIDTATRRGLACTFDQVLAFCYCAHRYTAGQLYPAITMCDYVLSNNDGIYDRWFSSAEAFIRGPQFLLSSAGYKIFHRCFDPLPECRNILRGSFDASDIEPLKQLGLWDSNKYEVGWVISDLLLTYLFNWNQRHLLTLTLAATA